MVASEILLYGERHLHHKNIGGIQEGDQEVVLLRGHGLLSQEKHEASQAHMLDLRLYQGVFFAHA